MRDAMALQRRRRLMLLQNPSLKSGNVAASSPADSRGFSDAVHSEPEADGATSQSARHSEAAAQLFHQCGGRRGRVLLVEMAGVEPQSLPLERPFVLIGRDRCCDLRIDDPTVLPRQAYVQWIDGRLFVCSLSTPSQKAPAIATWLDHTPVNVGPFRLSVTDHESTATPQDRSQHSNGMVARGDADPLSKSPALANEIPQVQLRFHGVEQTDNLWPVDRQLTLIGGGSQCKLRLEHADIPTVLAGLIRTPTSLWLVNLGGDDSLLVNDRPAAVQSLDIGDVLQMGPFQAEVTAAPISLKRARPVPADDSRGGEATVGDAGSSAVRELTTRHRQRLGTLSESLATVQTYLDAAHLDAVPELKSELQRYVLQAQRHHREMQEALDQLSQRK